MYLNWDKEQSDVTHALLIFHGGARNAVDYNHSGETAITNAGAFKQTILIAPQFLEDQDLKAFGIPATTKILHWKHYALEGEKMR